MNIISIEDLISKLKTTSINVIDIRPNASYIKDKIPTAKHIDKELLLNFPNSYLNKKTTYYIYCQSGISSMKVVNKLNALGYNTVNIDGGYNNYLLRK